MRFAVKVLRGGEISVLDLQAISTSDAALQAKKRGYAVISVKPKHKLGRTFRAAGAKFPLALFSQELLSLLTAGLSLVEALESLAEKEQRTHTKYILDSLLAAIREGKSFSAALEEFPAVFSSLYVAMIRSSETTGNLPEALSRYLAYHGQLDAVRKRVVSASIYPILLIVVGGLVLVFLLGYVVPRFSTIYENTGRDLPWMSMLLINWGRLVQANGLAVLLAALLPLAIVIRAVSNPAIRGRLISASWKLPLFGERMRVYHLARFYRATGMLLKGGIPVGTALEMVADLLPSGQREGLRHAWGRVHEGRSLSFALDSAGLTTPIALRLLRVGERTGQMGEMMERVAGVYDEDMSRAVEWFTRLFEPALMVLIGLLIGAIVLLMYLPIFELAGSIE